MSEGFLKISQASFLWKRPFIAEKQFLFQLGGDFMSSGDTGFIMLCSALVFLMTPGLAFFYGGLVRRKKCCQHNDGLHRHYGLSIVMWVLFGYSLSFGGNHAGIIGDFRYFAFQGVGADPGPYADTIPHLVFAGFQMMFAVITPALITGAVVGRMRFKALFLFIAFWFFDCLLSDGTYGMGEDGFLAALGSVDFAGGNVVHISSGVSALVLAICLGRRRGYEHTSYRIHNIPFVTLVHHCSGSDGLASMPEAAFVPTVSPPMPFW